MEVLFKIYNTQDLCWFSVKISYEQGGCVSKEFKLDIWWKKGVIEKWMGEKTNSKVYS